MFAIEQKIEKLPFTSEISWEWVLSIALAIWTGALFEQLWYENSDLKIWWRGKNKKFEVISLTVNGQMEPRARIAKTKIKFIKPISKGHLYLKAYTCTGLNRAPKVHVIDLGEISNITSDQEKEIVLATEAIAYPNWIPFHSTIGPPNSLTPVSLIGSSENIIELELKTLFSKQKTKFFIKCLSYGGADYGAGLYAQSEENDIFKI